LALAARGVDVTAALILDGQHGVPHELTSALREFTDPDGVREVDGH
jgi:hypothetical protein